MITSTINYKKLLHGVFLFFVLHEAWGQGMPQVIPPSPNAAAFSKYGNIPVSPYTGVPTINIPLYEIKIRDIKVPISLSYHASGIRVGEEASRVGLGWVLNAGGIITRNIVNRDDFQELPDSFLGSSAPAIPPGPVNVPSLRVQAGTTYGYYSTESQSGVPLYLDLAEYIVPTGIDPFFKPHDFEPDQFTYNFLSYSGKFIVNKNREVILEKQEKIRIRPLSTDGSTWEITTPDGFVYKFLDSEFFVDYNNTGGYRQKSAWYLTEIISPQNESVKFFYSAQENQYIIPVGSFYERWPSGNQFILCDFPCRDQNPRRHPIVGKYYSNIALDRIEWSHGKIKFNMASDREDIEGDKRITSIHLYRKDATDPYEEIVFLHDYFTSSSMGSSSTSEFPTNNPEKALKRLKLSGITRRGLPFATSQPEQYSFTYYDEIFPPKNSFARDHWGFYNGKYGNTSLIPEYKRVVAGAPTPSRVIGIMGTERDPSPNHVRALSLKSITYPTKGTTTFSYASNTFDFNPFENTNDEPESYPETTPFIYNASQKGIVQSKLFDLRDEFVDDDGNVVPVTVRAAFRTNMSATCDQVLGTPNVYFEVVNEAGLSFGVITPNGTRCTSPEQVGCITCVSGSPVFDYTGSFVLHPGKYYWKAYMPADEAQIVDIAAQFTWMVDAKKRPQLSLESDGSIKMYRIGGGLRVSQVEDYVPESDTKMNIRRYDYHYKVDENEDGVMETHSYGRRMVKPSYSYFDVTWEEKSTIVGLQRCYQCITLVRDSGHPHANYDGNSVAYDKVREYLGESGENGYTDYEYENEEDEVKNYNYPYPTDAGGEIPLLPPYSSTIKNPGNGNLLRQTQYTASGEKLMMTENTYQTKYNNIGYALESREIPADMDVLGGAYLLLSYESMISNFSYLSKTIVTSYLPGEIESNKVETQYFYDNSNHLQLTKQVTGKSNLHKQVTQYKYPADFTDVESNTAILDMKGDKFMHALPVETTVLDEAPDGSQMIQRREFTVFDNFGDFSLPKEMVTLKNTGFVAPADVPAYIPSGTYDAQVYKKVFALDYDTESGNLKKIQKESDMPVGYLWGHDNSLPIAEIKNGTAEEAFYTSFEEGGDLFTDASGSLARTGLKVTNSTTYTFPAEYAPIESNTLMSYWYWENNQWNFSGVIPFQRTITTSGSRIDEVRAFPKGAQMTTFTHLLMVGISSQTDANNQTTYYEYDEMSRLKLIRDSNKKIVKSYEYAYKR